jgi:hypothetical protein
MPHLRRPLALTLICLAVAPTVASAGIGDYHRISGPITLWGPNRFDQQLAVVQDDEGRKWVVRFGPGALPAGAASGWAVVPGAVQGTSGTTAVIRAAGGTVVTVDLSQLDADARTWVAPGRGVTVVGVYRADGVLTARGVATSTP